MKRWYAHRRWVYWGFCLLIAADIVLYVGWVRGLAAQLQVDPAALAALESEVSERAAEVERLRRVQTQAPTAAPRLDAFARERFWSESVGHSRTLAELTEAARNSGVRIGSLQYNQPSFKERPEMIQVEVNTRVDGSYANLLAFMQELERSPRFYLVQNLNVGGARGSTVQLDMTLVTYFRRGSA